ncbi:muT motif expression regulator [Penguinpox virus]|uniref:MuT motif expression regulator n=1 Tax=Penguinpox virus TaxID=648998 RepID=A0A068EGS1_9POXV|nr:muT motif expression regulator [Penguinpox virus]AID46795.1 muT motif expression regulator [Penguinpox virus]
MGEYYKNKLLLRPSVYSDNIQKIKLVAYEYGKLHATYPISVIGIMKTIDDKFILCHRYNSFLFSEIAFTKDKQRKIKLFKKHSKYMSNIERDILSYKLSLPNNYNTNHIDIIFPGGKIKDLESITNCLVREIKEELNIDSSYLAICKNCFVYGSIYDRLIDKDFEVIALYVETDLTSRQVLNKFIPNREIKGISFIDATDINKDYLYTNVIKYIINAVRTSTSNR